MRNILCSGFLLLFFLYSCAQENSDNKALEQATTTPTLETMIGQMMMVGTRGMNIKEVSPQFLKQIEEGKIGGIVLFDYDVIKKEFHRNIKSPKQLKKLVEDLQKAAPIPMFMGIDQEGGRVNRLKSKYGFPASVSAKYLGDLDHLDSTRHYTELAAKTLHDLGFNVNFAPVVDMDLNTDNPVIGKYERSISKEAEQVIKHSEIWIKTQDEYHILSTLKHFPGHGSSDADSHEGVTDITNYWQEKELIPFAELSKMDQNLAIMTAHVVNKKLDADYPATLSKKIITDILRTRLGFEGIVFSDDMQMKAVNEIFDFETILEKSINAGVDVLVFGNNLEYDELIPSKATDAILKMVKEGKISEERIQASYKRIMAAKNQLNLREKDRSGN